MYTVYNALNRTSIHLCFFFLHTVTEDSQYGEKYCSCDSIIFNNTYNIKEMKSVYKTT